MNELGASYVRCSINRISLLKKNQCIKQARREDAKQHIALEF